MVGTESTYTTTTADSGKDLQLLISYSDGQGYSETLAPLTATVEVSVPLVRGNSLYTIVDGPSWTEAEANSVKLRGHLVTINDAEENDWLFNAFEIPNERYLDVGGQLYLTGFTDREQEGDWRWISGEAVTYTNWAVGEPNNSYNWAPEDFMHLGWAANRKQHPSGYELSISYA